VPIPLQSVSQTSSTLTATTAAFGSALTSGTKLIAYVQVDATATPSTVKDTAGNSFTQILAYTTNATSHAYIYVLDTPAGDVGTKPTVTLTCTGTANGIAILVQEVAGLAPGTTAGACLDGSAGLANASPVTTFTWSWGAYSSTLANEYLVAFYGDTGDGSGTSNTTPPGYTADANNISSNANEDLRVYYKNSTGGAETVTNESVTDTGSIAWNTVLVAFKLAYTPAGSNGQNNGASGDPGPMSITPHAVGNFFLCSVMIQQAGHTVTALSATNITWTPLTPGYNGVSATGYIRTFIGVATSTSAASTSITFGGGAPTAFAYIVAEEFTTATGTPVLDATGHVDAGTGTAVWPNLTAAGPGELYWGTCQNGGAASAGSTASYTYNANADGGGNAMAFNLDTSGGTVTGPTWGDTNHDLGEMVLVTSGSFGTASTGNRIQLHLLGRGPNPRGPKRLAPPSAPAPPAPSFVPVAPQIRTSRRLLWRQPRTFISSGFRPSQLGSVFIRRRRSITARPRSFISTAMLPGTGFPSFPAAYPPNRLIRASRPRPPRSARSALTTGYPPGTLGAVYVRTRLQVPLRRRGIITGPLVPPVAVIASVFVPGTYRATPRAALRRPRSFIFTGMLPGAGVASFPQAYPPRWLQGRRYNYARHGFVTGPLAPGAGFPSFPAAYPPGRLTTAARRPAAYRPRSVIRDGSYRLPILGAAFVSHRPVITRRPRSTITTGFWPGARGAVFLAATRRAAVSRRRNTITGPLIASVVAVVTAITPAPVVSRRQQIIRRPRSFILTGMTPGSGVAFVPPPTPYVIARRRQPDKRPIHYVSGPFTPGIGVAAVPIVPAMLRRAARTGAAHPRSLIRTGMTPGLGTAFVQPSIFVVSRRQPLRRPRTFITTGSPPRILGYNFIHTVVHPLRRPHGFILGPVSPAAVIVVTPVVLPWLHASRRFPVLHPRPVIRTGMTPGLGVAFILPAPNRIVAIRRQPDRKARPRSYITGLKVFPVLFPFGLTGLSGSMREDNFAGTGTHDSTWGTNNPQTYGGTVNKDTTGGSSGSDHYGGTGGMTA
jgi:hypothetical protein